jgi:hypothetical protein
MICTKINDYIIGLLNQQSILWKCVLDSGVEVWSDFDLPDKKDPWTRLKHYCQNNNAKIIEVRVVVPGNPENVVYADENGLDGIYMVRGIAKDLQDPENTSFSFMTFGKLGDDGKIYVKRFYWPACEFGQYEEVREMTPENEELLYRKRKSCGDNCQCQSNEQK